MFYTADKIEDPVSISILQVKNKVLVIQVSGKVNFDIDEGNLAFIGTINIVAKNKKMVSTIKVENKGEKKGEEIKLIN